MVVDHFRQDQNEFVLETPTRSKRVNSEFFATLRFLPGGFPLRKQRFPPNQPKAFPATPRSMFRERTPIERAEYETRADAIIEKKMAALEISLVLLGKRLRILK